MLPKCPHGNYAPDGSGKSEYCSICFSPKPLTDEEAKIFHGSTVHDLPYKDKHCPKCGSIRFKYVSDWDYHCPVCSFDALTS